MSSDTRELFRQNCAACHGDDGAGDGPNAPVSPRSPANFRQVQPTADAALRIISDGVPGTTMPQWRLKLTDAQRQQLADYVRSLYHEGGTGE